MAKKYWFVCFVLFGKKKKSTMAAEQAHQAVLLLIGKNKAKRGNTLYAVTKSFSNIWLRSLMDKAVGLQSKCCGFKSPLGGNFFLIFRFFFHIARSFVARPHNIPQTFDLYTHVRTSILHIHVVSTTSHHGAILRKLK